eukprot:10847163-Alexandrium_andersonii.AAC.1
MQWEGAPHPVVVSDSWRCPMSSHAQQPFRWAGITISCLLSRRRDRATPAIPRTPPPPAAG